MEAGGYEDERWWATEAARRWRQGEGTADGPRAEYRKERSRLGARPDALRDWLRDGRSTVHGVEEWGSYLAMRDDEFEVCLERMFAQLRHTSPFGWNDGDWSHPSHPIVGVCWYEAQAYCRWLSSQTDVAIRLPSEAEWEAAARGRDARRYAWGDSWEPGRANFFAAVLPVGVFPDGDTPEGLIDITGNASEWTSSPYRPYGSHETDSGAVGVDEQAGLRVARGGLRLIDPGSERAAYRIELEPGYRKRNGFRLVMTLPSP